MGKQPHIAVNDPGIISCDVLGLFDDAKHIFHFHIRPDQIGLPEIAHEQQTEQFPLFRGKVYVIQSQCEITGFADDFTSESLTEYLQRRSKDLLLQFFHVFKVPENRLGRTGESLGERLCRERRCPLIADDGKRLFYDLFL